MYTLKLTRTDTATQGLVTAWYTNTVNKQYRQYKPGQLEELNLSELPDGVVSVSLVIGQTEYNVTNANLEVNGVNMGANDVDTISTVLSELFLDSIAGGGGGTPDVSTPPHVIYKNVGGQFDDSPTEYNEPSRELYTSLLSTFPTAEHQVIVANPSTNEIYQKMAGAFFPLFGVKKLNGEPTFDYKVDVGRLSQRIRCIFDEATPSKKVVIGSDLDFWPAGIVSIRAVLDEIAKEIYLQVRDTDDITSSKLKVEPDQITMETATDNGGTMRQLFKLLGDTAGGPLDKYTRLAGSDIGHFNPVCRIVVDENVPTRYIEIGSNDPASSIAMRFDIVRNILSLTADYVPRYTDNADAIANGLVRGDVYRINQLAASGNLADFLAIVD